MNDPIGIPTTAFRQDGTWRIRLELPDWVYDDLMRDVNASRLPYVMLTPMVSQWTSQRLEWMFAYVKFEATDSKKDED